jgi:hypothetical protein
VKSVKYYFWVIAAVSLFSASSYAITQGAILLAVSSSSQSVLIDIGSLDGVKVGERAKFLVPLNQKTSGDPNEKIKASVLAVAEAVKVNESGSYWRLKRLGGENSYQGVLKKRLRLRVMRMKRDPRRPFITRQTVKVADRLKGQSVIGVNESAGIPEDLIFAQSTPRQEVALSKTTATKRQDIEVVVKKSWVPSTAEYDEEFEDSFLGRSTPAVGNYALSERSKKEVGLEIWNKTTTGVQNKYNHLKYGLNALYRDSIDDDGTGINESIDGHVFSNRGDLEKLDQVAVRNALKRVKKNPYRWSQDLNDEELRQFVVESGIVTEVEKQKRALREKLSHEVILRYTTPLQSSTVVEGQGNQGLGYSLAIAYEFALSHLSEKWRPFSLEFELESLLSYHDIGGTNARFSELNGKLHLNWYFLRPPTMISRFMPFASLGFKRGSASVKSEDLSYTSGSLFSTRLGVKYRMSAGDGRRKHLAMGYGYQFMVGYDATTYALSNTSSDNIYTEFGSNQLKWSFGFSTYF